MIHKIAVALACLSLAATAGAQVNFDKGIDVKSIVSQVNTDNNKDFYPYPVGSHFAYASNDCRSFSFGPSAGPVSSGRVYLSSTEYYEYCQTVPVQQCHTVYTQQCHTVMVPGPNHTQVPQQQCTQVPHQECHTVYQQQCYTRPGQTFQATAQVNIAARQLYPWETESFNVCMQGQRVDFDPKNSPYSYDVNRVGMYDLTFNLTPNYRVPTKPDQDGMSYAALVLKDGKYTLTVNDKWADIYAGEQVAIKVELFKDGWWFFDSNKGQKTFTLNTAGKYELTFAEGDLTKNKDLMDDGSEKGATKYFVKWGFKRIGKVSTDAFVDKGSTPKISL
ncbi:MAG TPA: hypothetical protein PKI19_11870 [Elusimicrobiales bacterium]|nr:hypothetical protein [Elusimicrobiales bacterium]